MKRLMMALLCAFVAKAAGAETVYVTVANFESCRTLQNGNTYRFAEDIDYAASACQSAMTVADGANVVIVIAKGVVVSLTGGAASGTTGAGAGIEVPSNAKLIVAGAGELFAAGGSGAAGAVTINGGTVTATGGRSGAGIGGGIYGGARGIVTINSGAVTTTGGELGAGIGGGYGGSGGTVTIDGGSVKASSIQNQPKNAVGSPVYCVTVECGVQSAECGVKVEGLDGYGMRDIVSVDGKVYLWLPNGTHEFSIDGVKYRAVVNDAATTAAIYPTCEGGEIAEDEDGTWTVTPNAGVTEITVANLPPRCRCGGAANGHASERRCRRTDQGQVGRIRHHGRVHGQRRGDCA